MCCRGSSFPHGPSYPSLWQRSRNTIRVFPCCAHHEAFTDAFDEHEDLKVIGGTLARIALVCGRVRASFSVFGRRLLIEAGPEVPQGC